MSNTPTNPETIKKIRGTISEISDALTRIQSNRDLIKSIIDEKSEEYALDKKQLRKMATTFYKDNYSKLTSESEEFSILYETILRVTSAPQQ